MANSQGLYDVLVEEGESSIRMQPLDRLRAARLQRIDTHHGVPLPKQLLAQGGPDKPRPTRN